MIRLIDGGEYQLTETKDGTAILTLNRQNYAWVKAKGVGEILVSSYRRHKLDHYLAIGHYRIYLVRNEQKFTDLPHLELEAGHGIWQGYLLPTGLPTLTDRRNRIIPTDEILTKVSSINTLPTLSQVG